MAKIIKIYDSQPNERDLREICDTLTKGGVIIFPTDSYYAYGCLITNIKGINEIIRLRNKKNQDLSLICDSISMASDYGRIDNNAYRILRDHTPGAYTFVLPPLSAVPTKFLASKRSVGVRIPDSAVARYIVEMLGMPLVSSSIVMNEHEAEDRGNAELVYEGYGDAVSVFVDGGDVSALPTTVVNMSEGDIEIIREGQAEFVL